MAAQIRDMHQALISQAQQKIFNQLCVAYRRARQNPSFSVYADELRRELALPETVFAEALAGFVDAAGEKIVEISVRDGERRLTLGNSARFNLTD
jgi:hypothetical protein